MHKNKREKDLVQVADEYSHLCFGRLRIRTCQLHLALPLVSHPLWPTWELMLTSTASFKSFCFIFLMCPCSLQASKSAKAAQFLGQPSRLPSFRARGRALGGMRRDSHEEGNLWSSHSVLIWVHLTSQMLPWFPSLSECLPHLSNGWIHWGGVSLGTTTSLILVYYIYFEAGIDEKKKHKKIRCCNHKYSRALFRSKPSLPFVPLLRRKEWLIYSLRSFVINKL